MGIRPDCWSGGLTEPMRGDGDDEPCVSSRSSCAMKFRERCEVEGETIPWKLSISWRNHSSQLPSNPRSFSSLNAPFS